MGGTAAGTCRSLLAVSPLVNFGVLALCAEGLDLKLNGTLLQREEESPSSHVGLPEAPSSGFLPCPRREASAAEPLSKAGCPETEETQGQVGRQESQRDASERPPLTSKKNG